MVATAAAPQGDRGLLPYIAEPYNKSLGAGEHTLAQTQPVKNQIREISLEQIGLDQLSFSTSEKLADHRSPTVSSDGTVSWILTDSKGIEYHLTLTREDYFESTSDMPVHVQHLKTRNGSIVAIVDHARFIQSSDKLSTLADEIYRNAASDYDFVREVWYIVTHSTEYAPDATEEVSRPVATLYNGKGDCEDLTILMASILVASSHTENWDIKMVYFDASNPHESIAVNHVALFISTDTFSTFVELTNSELDGLNVWQQVDGWYVDVSTDKVQD